MIICLKPRQLTVDNYQQTCGHTSISIIECMILFGYTDNQDYSFRQWRALGLSLPGVWFSSWSVISIDTGYIVQSPQSGPRWSPAFKIEPVLFPPSETPASHQQHTECPGMRVGSSGFEDRGWILTLSLLLPCLCRSSLISLYALSPSLHGLKDATLSAAVLNTTCCFQFFNV